MKMVFLLSCLLIEFYPFEEEAYFIYVEKITINETYITLIRPYKYLYISKWQP